MTHGGSVATPALSWAGALDSGVFRRARSTIGFVIEGREVTRERFLNFLVETERIDPATRAMVDEMLRHPHDLGVTE